MQFQIANRLIFLYVAHPQDLCGLSQAGSESPAYLCMVLTKPTIIKPILQAHLLFLLSLFLAKIKLK